MLSIPVFLKQKKAEQLGVKKEKGKGEVNRKVDEIGKGAEAYILLNFIL